MSRNEAAERLVYEMKKAELTGSGWWEMVYEALATERRLTVERGRRLLADSLEAWFGPASDGMSAATRRAIVDGTFKPLDDLATAAVDEEEGKP